MQPRLLDRDVLEVVDLHWVGQAEDPADTGFRVRVGDLTVGEQLKLRQLLIDGHPREQVIYAPLDALTGGLPRRRQRALIAGARGGDHPARDQQAKRDNRHHDRGVTSSKSHRSSSRCSAAATRSRPRDRTSPNAGSAKRSVSTFWEAGTRTLMGISWVWLRGGASLAGLVTLLVLLVAAPAAAKDSQDQLRQYAGDTSSSFVAMTDAKSGLPADSLNADGTRSVQTSTTNIGAYMWSAVVAQRLGLISHAETVKRLSTTIGTLEHMERYQPAGQFYNWYDHRTGAKLTAWPPTGAPLTPILSSVDNGWLATGLRIVQRSVPELAARAGALYDSMDFGFYYRPDVNRVALLLRARVPATSPCCYDTVVSESRIVDYIGIAKGELPPKEYYGTLAYVPRHL